MPRSFSTPSSRLCWVLLCRCTQVSSIKCQLVTTNRKTAASDCIAFCMSSLIEAVDLGPSELRILSKNSMLLRPASSGIFLCGFPGARLSLMWLAQARPNTTMSRREFAPRRLAPWTDTQAASPAAYRPGTTLSLPFYESTSVNEGTSFIQSAYLVSCEDFTSVSRRNSTH